MRNLERATPIMMGLWLLTAPAVAGTAGPACSASEYRQFDFWVGDWTVTDSAGARTYGTNLVTREEDGCLVHEHWRGSEGGTGQSLNFYDPANRQWMQVWVASRGTVLRLAGHLAGGSMVLEGSGPSAKGPVLNRIVWTPEPDGRVRQVWSVSRDSGQTWTVTFDGWYRPVRPAAPAHQTSNSRDSASPLPLPAESLWVAMRRR
jgi:hypothetical protein